MPGRTTAGRPVSIPSPRSGAPQGGHVATPSSATPWSTTSGGVLLAVRLTPKGGRDAVDGIETLADGRAVLKARVRSAPVDGAANTALIALIAKTVGVPRSAVNFVAGETARIKRLRIAGDPMPLVAALEQAADQTIGANRKVGGKTGGKVGS
jgi:uncharacterized protein (TIGR00251 family)